MDAPLTIIIKNAGIAFCTEASRMKKFNCLERFLAATLGQNVAVEMGDLTVEGKLLHYDIGGKDGVPCVLVVENVLGRHILRGKFRKIVQVDAHDVEG
jgi:hypothetical protein